MNHLPALHANGFAQVPVDDVKVVQGGQGIRTHDLTGCIAIAGIFTPDADVAFMTHWSPWHMGHNISDIAVIADKYHLKSQPGTIIIFRKAPSQCPDVLYQIDGSEYSYEQIVSQIKKAAASVFPKSHIKEINYSNRGLNSAGEAVVDLIKRKYSTDIESGSF